MSHISCKISPVDSENTKYGKRQAGHLNCSEAEHLIPNYLNDQMDNWQLEEFLDHVKTCADCREELTIQLLVKVGLQKLEESGDFNLIQEMNAQMEEAEHRLKVRNILQNISFVLQALVLISAVVMIWLAGRIL